jgi:uncharacterized repeat protein (TIGR03843 family)
VSSQELDLLSRGLVEIEGRFSNSSNATFLVRVELDGDSMLAVYKPEAGERPLWDFPPGLWRREVAASVLSEHLGLGLVPLTIAREDLPAGPGSIQRYVDEDPEQHFFTLRDHAEHEPTLRALAAFDVVANNSDRKSGHVLAAEGSLWAIDHGLCFHAEDKLRTVIWDYAGDPLDDEVRAGIERLLIEVPASLLDLLSGAEVDATLHRARTLLELGELPVPDEDAPYPPYPWPLI